MFITPVKIPVPVKKYELEQYINNSIITLAVQNLFNLGSCGIASLDPAPEIQLLFQRHPFMIPLLTSFGKELHRIPLLLNLIA